ncbi:GGDEF domain-containing protein [Companilactobacillus suantsaicola]|uniref:GGDEF domain-containing protein n=1 Tax=Companilactobacillus suantsaicola TaxID=2487723 RepID=A0A4Z0JJH9_9LACO|nr:GGDEF domain-containing protein [Companilactobacillus suantsaicola]TGD22992.1 GGDEF domain-containing protein [Companilactobacillus suantsaicola]
MLTGFFVNQAPLVTSLFFIMGAFIVFQIFFSGAKRIALKINENIDIYYLRAILGIIYILLVLFIMQSFVRDETRPWVYVNFQLISLLFYTGILSVPFKVHFFTPIVLAFMLFNSALTSWQSWLLAIILIAFYYSLNYIKNNTKDKFPFFKGFLAATFYGIAYWIVTSLKFPFDTKVLIQQIIYYIILELFTLGYIAMLYSDLESRAALFRKATHDKLTTAYNYDAFDIALRALFKKHLVYHQKFTMVMFDIDHFKQVNDTYGHLAGDKVLQEVVDIVRTVLKNNDRKLKLYRTGGEEFNIIFPNYELVDTKQIVDEIFQAVNHSEVVFDQNHIKVTISVGVSEANHEDTSINDFYSRVDKALYKSKRSGRMAITVI